MFRVDGVPPYPRSWFVRFPVPRSGSGSTSVSAGKGRSETRRQWGEKPRVPPPPPPPWCLAHFCLVPKRDASSHAPNGADHTQSLFMFFPGAVFPGEGKQLFRPGLVSILAGWPSPPGGGRNLGVSPSASYKDALLGWASLGGAKRLKRVRVRQCPFASRPEGWPRGPGAPRTPGQGANRNSTTQLRPGSLAPFALRSSPVATLLSDLAGYLVPGAGLAGNARQPRQEGGSDPGRSRGEEAEEKEKLRQPRPGAFTSPGVKAGPFPSLLP